MYIKYWTYFTINKYAAYLISETYLFELNVIKHIYFSAAEHVREVTGIRISLQAAIDNFSIGKGSMQGQVL